MAEERACAGADRKKGIPQLQKYAEKIVTREGKTPQSQANALAGYAAPAGNSHNIYLISSLEAAEIFLVEAERHAAFARV